MASATGSFQYSKIGFNVHHALDGSVGRPYRAQTARGELRGSLPEAIDPQRIVGGTLSGMFDPYEELAIEVVDGVEAVVRLEGDLLELQDHRNWTDANFKSYATPLALGFPFDSVDGLRIRQVLTIHARGDVARPTPTRDPVIEIGEPLGRRLPAIGLGQPGHDGRCQPERPSASRPSVRHTCAWTFSLRMASSLTTSTSRLSTRGRSGPTSSSPSPRTRARVLPWPTWRFASGRWTCGSLESSSTSPPTGSVPCRR